MGLLKKIFKPGDRDTPQDQPPSGTQFQDSDSDDGRDEDAAQRTAVRRELVQVTLRETMRRHAVPSDWLEVRMLPVVTRSGKNGMHVQLIVKQGQGSLLGYIPSFQSAFMGEIEKFEPRAWDWLLSISWQFATITSKDAGELPGAGAAAAAVAASTAPMPPSDALEPDSSLAALAPATDEDVAQDLQALFATLQAPPPAADAGGDFEPTAPGAGA